MDTTYRIEGMHCGSCVGRVQKAVQRLVSSAEVTLQPPQVRISGPTVPQRESLAAAVASAGKYTLGTAVEAMPEATVPARTAGWLSTYWPLLLIVAYIAVASIGGSWTTSGITWSAWMSNFMAGFFLVFSAFKFLDLRGFADAYATYDLAASRWRAWGLVYPFLELALGLAYLFRFAPSATNLATVLLMAFSSLGVIAALRRRQQIRCACLGTVLKLPMSTITLVEDLGMVAMAAMALGHGLS